MEETGQVDKDENKCLNSEEKLCGFIWQVRTHTRTHAQIRICAYGVFSQDYHQNVSLLYWSRLDECIPLHFYQQMWRCVHVSLTYCLIIHKSVAQSNIWLCNEFCKNKPINQQSTKCVDMSTSLHMWSSLECIL